MDWWKRGQGGPCTYHMYYNLDQTTTKSTSHIFCATFAKSIYHDSLLVLGNWYGYLKLNKNWYLSWGICSCHSHQSTTGLTVEGETQVYVLPYHVTLGNLYQYERLWLVTFWYMITKVLAIVIWIEANTPDVEGAWWNKNWYLSWGICSCHSHQSATGLKVEWETQVYMCYHTMSLGNLYQWEALTAGHILISAYQGIGYFVIWTEAKTPGVERVHGGVCHLWFDGPFKYAQSVWCEKKSVILWWNSTREREKARCRCSRVSRDA